MTSMGHRRVPATLEPSAARGRGSRDASPPPPPVTENGDGERPGVALRVHHECAPHAGADRPCVSFVVIAFNEAANIRACLDALAVQDASCSTEFIVVDDASTDATEAIAASFAAHDPRARVIVLGSNGGRGAARAAGVAACSGDYIAFVDADIVLPPDWLSRALEVIEGGVDACGGVPVPDGDVAYVCTRFGLRARPVMPVAVVPGSNGLFRRAVFERVGFSPEKRNGEDIDLVRQMSDAGLRMQTIADLVVEHCEAKGFGRSVRWLFESGAGASAQFRAQRVVRPPDIAFAGLIGSLAAGAVIAGSGRGRLRAASAIPVAYIGLMAFLHLSARVDMKATPARSAAAWLCNSLLLASYFGGRIVGLLSPRGRTR